MDSKLGSLFYLCVEFEIGIETFEKKKILKKKLELAANWQLTIGSNFGLPKSKLQLCLIFKIKMQTRIEIHFLKNWTQN